MSLTRRHAAVLLGALLGFGLDAEGTPSSSLAIQTPLLTAPSGVAVVNDRTIAVSDFHRLPGNKPDVDTMLLPGEMIVAVDLPDSPFARHSHYLKIRDRASYAFALVSVAFCALRDLATRKIPAQIPSLFITLLTTITVTTAGGVILVPLGGWTPPSMMYFSDMARIWARTAARICCEASRRCKVMVVPRCSWWMVSILNSPVPSDSQRTPYSAGAPARRVSTTTRSATTKDE